MKEDRWALTPVMREAWEALGCTHELPEDCRIYFVQGWNARALLDPEPTASREAELAAQDQP